MGEVPADRGQQGSRAAGQGRVFKPVKALLKAQRWGLTSHQCDLEDMLPVTQEKWEGQKPRADQLGHWGGLDCHTRR